MTAVVKQGWCGNSYSSSDGLDCGCNNGMALIFILANSFADELLL